MHLLDTDTLTHLYAGHPRVGERLRQIADPDIGITIVTKAEMLRGRIEFLLKAASGTEIMRAQQLFQRTEAFIADLLVIPFDEAASAHFERLRASRSNRTLGHADLLIASIALAYRATLVTRNLRHFRPVPGLAVANWVD